MIIEPDTKDWTWVLDKTCPECGFDSRAFTVDEIPDLVRANARAWREALAEAGADVAVRPVATVWSPLEYACHVRDVYRLFDQRVALMLDQDDPQFENWDQDAQAVEDDYGLQDPAAVVAELAEAAEDAADRYASVSGDQWERTGRRSDGSVFTVESLARYQLHDVMHHVYDVRS